MVLSVIAANVSSKLKILKRWRPGCIATSLAALPGIMGLGLRMTGERNIQRVGVRCYAVEVHCDGFVRGSCGDGWHYFIDSRNDHGIAVDVDGLSGDSLVDSKSV